MSESHCYDNHISNWCVWKTRYTLNALLYWKAANRTKIAVPSKLNENRTEPKILNKQKKTRRKAYISMLLSYKEAFEKSIRGLNISSSSSKYRNWNHHQNEKSTCKRDALQSFESLKGNLDHFIFDFLCYFAFLCVLLFYDAQELEPNDKILGYSGEKLKHWH